MSIGQHYEYIRMNSNRLIIEKYFDCDFLGNMARMRLHKNDFIWLEQVYIFIIFCIETKLN